MIQRNVFKYLFTYIFVDPWYNFWHTFIYFWDTIFVHFWYILVQSLVYFSHEIQNKIDKNQQIELLEKVAEKLNDDLEGKSDNSQIISELKSELESLKSETWQFEKFQRNGRRFTYILAHILLLLVPIIQLSFKQKVSAEPTSSNRTRTSKKIESSGLTKTFKPRTRPRLNQTQTQFKDFRPCGP